MTVNTTHVHIHTQGYTNSNGKSTNTKKNGNEQAKTVHKQRSTEFRLSKS